MEDMGGFGAAGDQESARDDGAAASARAANQICQIERTLGRSGPRSAQTEEWESETRETDRARARSTKRKVLHSGFYLFST